VLRLRNSPSTELMNAAKEQMKITELRLRKLIGPQASPSQGSSAAEGTPPSLLERRTDQLLTHLGGAPLTTPAPRLLRLCHLCACACVCVFWSQLVVAPTAFCLSWPCFFLFPSCCYTVVPGDPTPLDLTQSRGSNRSAKKYQGTCTRHLRWYADECGSAQP
jgi:hypothetical protein